MKRYIYIAILSILVSFTSCTMTDIDVDVKVEPSANSGLQFIGAAEDFDIHNVGTRADEEISDSHITEMTMLIFKKDGTMLPAVDANGNALPSSHINIKKPNPTFLIEANKYNGTGILASMEAGITAKYYDNTVDDLTECKIYIVANAYHLIGDRLEAGEIKTETDLINTILATGDSLTMPVDDNGAYIGLPMIGVAWEEGKYDANGERVPATFNLKYNGNNTTNAVATIPLRKPHSKVCFTMQVNSLQYVQGSGNTPQFELTDVKVYNIPAQMHLGYKAGDYLEKFPDGQYLYSDGISLKNTALWPKRTITKHDSSDKIEFHFFMPEHKVTPYFTRDTYNGYPENLPKDRRQYYKPKLVAPTSVGGITESKIATFVRIFGKYTTHNGEILEVSYDIYLGQDEIDDFEIKRNQQLNNIITINGLTNHKDAYSDVDVNGDGVIDEKDNNISIDHRVQVTNLGYLLSMEREAILDSHFEVRPLDITLSPGRKMTLVIPEDYRSWLAMESDAEAYTGANSPYVSDSPRRGVRKYFTTNLVSELWDANKGKITVEHSGASQATEIHRIWFYIDENPNVYDKALPGKDANGDDLDYKDNNVTEGNVTYNISRNLYRLGKVNFYLSEDDTAPNTEGNPKTTVNFQQWNLWRVWSQDGKRYYDIEHEEEYLNNYASDQPYKEVQDGMPYGLEGIQLSRHYKSIVASQEGSSLTSLIQGLFKSITDMADAALGGIIHYDFYLPRDFEDISLTQEQQNSLTIRPYSGSIFNEELAETLRASSDSKAKIDEIILTENPKSAFAYCYHKNKRNSSGVVETQKWFLPAIDEIEEIAVGAYDEFDQVFQDKKYWSCQPVYDKESLKAKLVGKVNLGTTYLLADYFVDNTNRARATSVIVTLGTDGTKNFTNIPSNAPGYAGKREGNANGVYGGFLGLELQGFDFDLTYTPITISDSEYAKVQGNLLRTEKCRVRAVYRSGTGTKPGGTTN